MAQPSFDPYDPPVCPNCGCAVEGEYLECAARSSIVGNGRCALTWEHAMDRHCIEALKQRVAVLESHCANLSLRLEAQEAGAEETDDGSAEV